MTTERDPQTRLVMSWLREDAHENAERVLLLALDEVDTTPQRRSWWPAWRGFRMNKLMVAAAATPLVLAVAVLGYTLLPRLGILGPGATPAPTPTMLARGSFVLAGGGYTVAIDSVALGSSASGRLTVSEGASGPAFTVGLQCTRTLADGSILIAGITTVTSTGVAPEGSYAGIVLMPGSPAQGAIWSQRGGPGSAALTCLGYLEEQSRRLKPGVLAAIVGPIELGSSVASQTLLARGSFDIRDWNLVGFEAFRDGSSVTGRLEARRTDQASPYMQIDFECAQEAADGLIVIGGHTAPSADGPGGSFAAIAVLRGPPVGAGIWAYGTSMPGVVATDCPTNADAWSRMIQHSEELSMRTDFEGTIELGP